MSEGRDINEDWRRAQLEAHTRREAAETAERERRRQETIALTPASIDHWAFRYRKQRKQAFHCLPL